MGHIKFKLEDGTALSCDYIDDTNFIEFALSPAGTEQLNFKMHRIQIQALIKAVNGPLKLGLDLKK